MAFILKTDRGTLSFRTVEEAEEYGRISYVSGAAPNYQILRDDKVKAHHMLKDGKVVSARIPRKS